MNVLLVVIVITSIITVLLVLLNRGQGGGLSDMFGGGMTSSLNSSGMASKNLIRLTITVTVIWVIAVVLYGLALRFNGQFVLICFLYTPSRRGGFPRGGLLTCPTVVIMEIVGA